MKNTERNEIFRNLLSSRGRLISQWPQTTETKAAEEGGCGVVGFASSVPVGGKYIFEPSIQMHNRGNGKGGGIACASLNHNQLGLDEQTLKDDYILQIALIDPTVEAEVEKLFVEPNFKVDHTSRSGAAADWQDLGLPVQPPDIVRYFVRVKEDKLAQFAESNGLSKMNPRDIEDEFVYQNSVQLNQRFYASLGEKQAFVLSHARNLMIFKIVGYAENVVKYYGLDDFEAQIWIAHQRYPTKGRVWHPAGAHPFIGMNEALVHNGDFANYHSVSEYLKQHNIATQFLTDTEVSALMFDLLNRTYKYPLEYVIEALAPTLELDFDRLPQAKQPIYKQVQSLHTHASPDGPWFFIIAQSKPDEDMYRLIGITDTAMLRPQVFAIQEGDVSIGLVGSEKQAIDATLQSLSADDPRFRPVADRYWNARGGSYTDGGAFTFSIDKSNGGSKLSCADKFGNIITSPPGDYKINLSQSPAAPSDGSQLLDQIQQEILSGQTEKAYHKIALQISDWGLDQLRWLLAEIEASAATNDDLKEGMLTLLTLLNDRRYNCGTMRRSRVLELVRSSINRILDAVPDISKGSSGRMARIDWASREAIRKPSETEKILVIYARDFEPEGDDCDSQLAVKAFKLGWNRFMVYGLKGQRFHGCGFGPNTSWVRFDIYGASGDYIASGIDGMDIHIHDNAQDQLGQIMKNGKLVVYGDVGQTFMYGAKGGDVYVMGNAAGRPLINAVGGPRVVINGTSLDFLAESFMAGDPHNGGGFVVLNGMEFNDQGQVIEQQTPYPGSNLFSLASGGAIFVRDPHKLLVEEQLNGGEFAEVKENDWELILPYLKENERLFGISIENDLLTVDGQRLSPGEVYRKVRAIKMAVLAKMDDTE